MKTRVLFMYLCVFNIQVALAQVVISGKVTDYLGKPVPFATLKFYENSVTSENIKAEKIADEEGHFLVEIPKVGNYIIGTSAIGYSDFYKNLEINSNQEQLALTFPKEKVRNIQEVVIKKGKPAIVRKLDRVVLNISDNPIAVGKSSIDLFRMAPGVFVNGGKISINGVWGARVMVDGKMLNLSGEDLKNYLQNLKSNDIQSIEVIAHPSAEFEAEGSGGLINIILKKTSKQGFSGNLGYENGWGLGKFPSYNPFFVLNYKRGKFGVNTSYSFNHDKSYELLEQQRDFTNGGKYQNRSDDTQIRNANRIKMALTYDISPKQFLGIGYTGQLSKFSSNSLSDTKIMYPLESEAIFSKGNFPTETKTGYHNFGMNYSIKTDSLGSKFTLLSDFTYNDRRGINTSNSESFDYQNKLLDKTVFRLHFPSISKIFTVDSKYKWNFKNSSSLNFGAKLNNTKIDNTNTYENFDGLNWVGVVGRNFDFNYNENVFAGYTELSGSFRKVEYQIGVRAEQTDVNATLMGSQKGNVSQNYLSFFPSVFMKKNLNEEGSNYLSLSFNRRIKRPSYFDLNPYEYYIDNYSVSTGNPYLKPQFTSSFEIGSIWKGTYYVAVSYSYTKDMITQMIQTNPNTELLKIIKANAGNTSVYTTTFSVPFQIRKWWSTTNNLLLTYTKSESPNFLIEKPSFVFQTEHEISLPKGYKMSMNAFYTPQMVSGNALTGAIGSIDLGIQKKFLENKLVARVAISDIFYTNNFRAKSYFNNTIINLNHKEQSRVLSLSLNYSFSGGDKPKLQKMESSNNEEKGRL
ncbi:TonB-dependent receptor [Riemerella anatipestifer]|uniref:outer membrane beta-barrel family protein n=1 Tax=Riemerella anatipestifer TaxID=34085 RepID=UPI001AD65CFD|nr:outer membrane beta-barrel family protein [Riemerella anatipestifer]MBO4234415.1 TonB-dependent receptor [Riemerella anatipestifer]